MRAALLMSALLIVALAACDTGPDQPDLGAPTPEPSPPGPEEPRETATADEVKTPGPAAAAAAPEPTPSPEPTEPETAEPAAAAAERPAWLGTRELPTRPDGYGEVQQTPAELVDRRLPAPGDAPHPPPEDETFAATIEEVPDEVAARSTWSPECPVGLGDLRYVTVTFWGFDERAHTGELLVHARAAEDLVRVFEQLYEARFPIEEMRVVDEPELSAPPTGDGNNTTAFVCRPAVGQTRWSDHAHGLAVDINPFHNPYVRDDLVLPELATAYVDRDDHRPGMIQRGDVVTEAFSAIGWGWGGDWQTALDWMHFSETGR